MSEEEKKGEGQVEDGAAAEPAAGADNAAASSQAETRIQEEPKKTTRVVFQPEPGPEGKAETTRVVLMGESDKSKSQPLEEEEIPLGVMADGPKSGPHPQRPATIRITKRGGIKQETAKIPPAPGEPATTVVASAAKAPKTIRLQRPATTVLAESPVKAAGPVSSTVKTIRLKKETSKIVQTVAPDGKKRTETSRIQLEDVPAEAEQPKTIRLKKPSSIMAVKPSVIRERPDTGAPTGKGETARIEIVKPDEASVPVTQRRTVKLKRKEAVSEGEPAQKEWLEPKREAAEETSGSKAVEVVFSVISLAAMLIMGFLVYILAVQATPEKQLPVPNFWL